MSADQTIPEFQPLDDDVLRKWPLPMPRRDGDKEERGRVLIVAGSREMPGVAALCATAALRAGAGKVTIATGAGLAPMVAIAMPECRVIGLRETAKGGFEPDASALDGLVEGHDAILMGPGMLDEESVLDFVGAVLANAQHAKLVLDAFAMGIVCDTGERCLPVSSRPAGGDEPAAGIPGRHILITPHAGEFAHLTGAEKDAVQEDPQHAALNAAQKWNAIVALKGAVTHIAMPEGRGWRHCGGSIGLSASGTGDILAGIIAGLAARGAPLEQAAAWGVVLHALAGTRLESRFGTLGYLAREIPAEIPALMHEFA